MVKGRFWGAPVGDTLKEGKKKESTSKQTFSRGPRTLCKKPDEEKQGDHEGSQLEGEKGHVLLTKGTTSPFAKRKSLLQNQDGEPNLKRRETPDH